jgi:hypothetical protein
MVDQKKETIADTQRRLREIRLLAKQSPDECLVSNKDVCFILAAGEAREAELLAFRRWYSSVKPLLNVANRLDVTVMDADTADAFLEIYGAEIENFLELKGTPDGKK